MGDYVIISRPNQKPLVLTTRKSLSMDSDEEIDSLLCLKDVEDLFGPSGDYKWDSTTQGFIEIPLMGKKSGAGWPGSQKDIHLLKNFTSFVGTHHLDNEADHYSWITLEFLSDSVKESKIIL